MPIPAGHLVTAFTALVTVSVTTSAAGARGGESPAFAVIATNNRSLTLARPDLHYADDDGAKYAELFSDLLGRRNVTLLTRFDAGSRLLFPSWAATARAPTLARFEAAIDETAQRVIAARREGKTAEVYLVLAGHGDVAETGGFIELADGPLTASRLDAILARLKTARVHLLLDSCNSWFMLNARKPGGKRWVSEGAPTLLKSYPNVGALISTSSEGATYEWSQLQSGIFSYVVRSGLRGAADVDLNGRVTYSELAAFIRTANSTLVNPLYRPKVYARGPSNLARNTVAVWGKRSAARAITVSSSGERRLTIRDNNGVRLLDAHKEGGTALTLHLPKRGRYTVEETRPAAGNKRPTRRVKVLGADTPSGDLEALPLTQDASRARGTGGSAFGRLFARPHGRRAYTRYLAETSKRQEPAHYSATIRDVARLQHHLQTAVALERDGNTYVGLLSVGGSLSGLGLGTALALDRNLTGSRRGVALATSFGAGTLMLASGMATLLTAKESDRLLTEIQELSAATDKQRAHGMAAAEARLEALVERYAAVRLVNGGLMAGGGALMLIPGVMGLTSASDDDATTASSFVAGVGLVAMAVYLLTEYRFPMERTWELYLRQRDTDPRPSDAADASVKIGPSVSASGQEPTPTVGVHGSF